jgi:hypothetical protein
MAAHTDTTTPQCAAAPPESALPADVVREQLSTPEIREVSRLIELVKGAVTDESLLAIRAAWPQGLPIRVSIKDVSRFASTIPAVLQLTDGRDDVLRSFVLGPVLGGWQEPSETWTDPTFALTDSCVTNEGVRVNWRLVVDRALLGEAGLAAHQGVITKRIHFVAGPSDIQRTVIDETLATELSSLADISVFESYGLLFAQIKLPIEKLPPDLAIAFQIEAKLDGEVAAVGELWCDPFLRSSVHGTLVRLELKQNVLGRLASGVAGVLTIKSDPTIALRDVKNDKMLAWSFSRPFRCFRMSEIPHWSEASR